MPLSPWQRQGRWDGGRGHVRRSWPPPGLGNRRRGAGLRPGTVDAFVVSFDDGATGAGVFNSVGAGAGAGIDTIVSVFVDNAVRGADRSADASGAAANAIARLRGDLVLASAPTHPAFHQCLCPKSSLVDC